MSDLADAQTRALAADEIEAVAGAVIAIIQPQCRPMESLTTGGIVIDWSALLPYIEQR